MFERIEHEPWFRRKILLLFGIIIVVIVLFEIWSVNRLATYGIQIAGLEQSKAALKLENQVLENEIARKTSLIQVQENAKKFGFEKIKQIEYIK